MDILLVRRVGEAVKNSPQRRKDRREWFLSDLDSTVYLCELCVSAVLIDLFTVSETRRT